MFIDKEYIAGSYPDRQIEFHISHLEFVTTTGLNLLLRELVEKDRVMPIEVIGQRLVAYLEGGDLNAPV